MRQNCTVLINKDLKQNTDLLKKERTLRAVDEIFGYWLQVMGKAVNTKITDARAAKIKKRLESGYSVDDIKKSIYNCSQSAFHMGANDNGAKFNDLTLICRSDEKLEFFRDMRPSAKDDSVLQGIMQFDASDLN